jgi:hypothetical protein
MRATRLTPAGICRFFIPADFILHASHVKLEGDLVGIRWRPLPFGALTAVHDAGCVNATPVARRKS